MNIKILGMDIENFKGISSLHIRLTDKTNIYGQNASGKTSIHDAFRWLLFNTDSVGNTKFDIRPLDSNGALVDNVVIAVQAGILVDDKAMTLRKEQRQIWTKRRGSETVSFQGNKNEYFIDTFPVSESEFKEKVASIINADLFKLITDPKQFASLKWQDQRELLMKLITDVTDETVLAAGGEKYEPVKDEILLGGAEKTLQKARKTMSELKKKQDELPVRIDEASKQIVDVDDEYEIELKRNEVVARLNSIKAKREDVLGAHKGIDEVSIKLMALHRVLAETQQNEQKKVNKARYDARSKVDGLRELMASLNGKKSRFSQEIEAKQTALESARQAIEQTREDYMVIRDGDITGDALICPTCGQPFPEDKAEEIIAKFDERKRRHLEELTVKGNSQKKQMLDLTAEIELLKESIFHIDAQLQSAQDELVKAQAAYDALPELADLDGNETIIDLRKQIAEHEALLKASDDGAEIKAALKEEEAKWQAELNAVNRLLAAVESNKAAKKRIESLREEQRNVGQLVALQEQKIYLLEEFSREKMTAMSDGINRCFEKVNFKLFEMQINGGMRETCEMTMNGVPYSSLNSAAKMQAGLDVIRTLSRLYNVTAPIWCDNRESVTDIPEMDAQVISLYVSPEDKELRVEEG